MQTQRTVDGALTPESPDPTPAGLPVVPQRSARRATARRASSRRATARRRKDDVEARIVEYLKEHPQSTTGDIGGRLSQRGMPSRGRRDDLIGLPSTWVVARIDARAT